MIRSMIAAAALTLVAAPAFAADVYVQTEVIGDPNTGAVTPRDLKGESTEPGETSVQATSTLNTLFVYDDNGTPTPAVAQGLAYGYGDLAAGKVGAKASSNRNAKSSAYVDQGDVLTFSAMSADPLVLTVRHHGFYSAEATGIAESFFQVRVGGYEGVFQNIVRFVGAENDSGYDKGFFTGFGGPGVGNSGIAAVLIDDQSSAGVFDRTFRISIPIPTGKELFLGLNITAVANNGATATFDQTGSITVAAPAGVTFSSQSGVFPGSVAAAVPEPASWGLMLLGFGATGLALRRRRALAA